jgi:16S rRNA (cytosine967-C5)-methyltransferase
LQNKQSRTARFAATEILCQLYEQKSPVKPLFERIAKRCQLGAKDRGLAMQLVYGVLRKRQSLDRILEILSTTPLVKLEPFIHQALAVALYQIFFLERIPDSAAVNEAVKSCKVKKIPKRLHGFVNGVLRQAIRQRGSLEKAAQTSKSGRKILNHPEWLSGRWQDNFGAAETEKLCAINNLEPPLTLRINRAKTSMELFCKRLDDQNVFHQPGRYAAHALVLPRYQGSIVDIAGFDEGLFQVQDEAAQLATTLLAPFTTAGIYLDACAGLGGKTSHLLEFAQHYSFRLHAAEPEQFRTAKLEENISRLFNELPAERLTLHKKSLLQLLPQDLDNLFDGVLVDAPCSGTGVIRRQPDIRWNRSEGDIISYQQQQLTLLSHGARLLRPGGILVYASCSIEPEENGELIELFLQQHSHFSLTDCAPLLPPGCKNLVAENFFRPLPSLHIDGFFAARMQRIN